MFLRLVYESFRRQKRRKLLAGVAIMLGVGVATAMIAVATDIGDKISRELRTYGANLIVTPQEDTLDVEIGGVNLKPPSDGAYLDESDLPKIKGMFWRNNIVGFSPMLPVTVSVAKTSNLTSAGHLLREATSYSARRSFVTGVRITHPWWKVQGAWPDDNSARRAARRASGREARDRSRATVLKSLVQPTGSSGILSTGGAEDDQVVAPLTVAQQIARQARSGAPHLRQRHDQA